LLRGVWRLLLLPQHLPEAGLERGARARFICLSYSLSSVAPAVLVLALAQVLQAGLEQ
jgi:hypothetical protein